MTDDTWGQVCNELQKAVGQNNYTTWIAPLELIDLEDGIASFQAPTKFMCDWVSRNFAEPILSELRRAGVSAERVNISVPSRRPMNGSANGATRPTVPAPAPAAPAVKPRKTPRPDEPLPGAPLDSRFTFDSFVVGKPNELAHAAAKRVAEGGPVTFNPLFLYGGVGLGKTHLMHAIAHDLQHQRPDLRVLYLSAEQFMYRFVQALREKQIMDFKEMFRSIDVLMVDDVQFIAGKDSTQEEFFHTFNALYQNSKQIVLSSDRAPSEIPQLEERLVSRFGWGLVTSVAKPDYETRLAIVRAKAQVRGLEISDDVICYIATRIDSNAREMEGAITTIQGHAALQNKQIDLALARKALGEQEPVAGKTQITLQVIIDAVTRYYNVRLGDLQSKRRHKSITEPRQICMWLARKHTRFSLEEIGGYFGGRDHTTVMHSIRTVEQRMSIEAVWAAR
ncbi:chromosomal replication initiator protein DnaA, partial [Thioclava electrotropha]|uniref:chromosomal replication initiator protein DnaA n=1 Tax=Thioclava electrotropha TaxID=1549850 RepID=UPI0023A87561